METRKWEPPGTTPCCDSHAFLPLTWLAARTYLAVGRCFWWQRDDTPIWPRT
jgi:hypothetical protein